MMDTRKDPILSKVLYYSKGGWPGKHEPDLLPYFNKLFELSHEDAVLLWGSHL